MTELTQTLAGDEEAGFQQFRRLFFEALERRRLNECRALLDILCAADSPRLQRDCRYHEAILHFELRQYDQAELILRRLLADDLSPIQRARALLELAIQLDEQGQWTEAEQFYLEALTAYQALGDPSGQARTYNNLGISITFQVEQGDSPHERLKEAIACHLAGLELAQAAADTWEVARNWHGLGMAYSLQTDYPAALAAFQEHVAMCQALDDPCDRAISLSDLAALVYHPQDQQTEALASLDQAIAILDGCDDASHLAEALTRRGRLLAAQNRLAEALADYNAALARTETIRARLTAPTAQADYRATVEFIYTAPLSLHLHQGDAVRAFNAAERARSRVLADLLAGQAAQPHVDIPGHLLEQRAVLRQALDQAYAGEKPATNLADLEQELAGLDRHIELLDPTYAGLETTTALTAEEVGDRLPPGTALLTYAGDADDRLWILLLSPAGLRAEPINNVSVRWLRGYLARQLDSHRRASLLPDPHTGHLSPPSLFPQLHQALLTPVQDLLQQVQTVYLVPFGPLHYLPLGALIPQIGASPPLLAAGRRVVYAPSATILLNYCHRRPPSTRQGLLAVAPADERLQFTLDAAATLARRSGSAALAGQAATRQAFLAEAGRYRTLCFLGHALFDQRHPMASRLKLADGSLHASEILRELRLQADLVILSACETGRSQVLRGDEILGLSRAMLYAGTPSLLVTLWPVHEIPTRLLVEKLVEQLSLAPADSAPLDAALALAATQSWLRDLSYAEAAALLAQWSGPSAAEVEQHLIALWQMTHPGQTPQAESRLFAHPFFWSPYILIGDQDQRA
ncbi:MAG: CHAT domain-containing protein [Anaerolineales bacterium]|nr:CHAT domain-containing protein [Anaerolineales bacterium]